MRHLFFIYISIPHTLKRPCTYLLLNACVLAQLKKFKNVCMPRLDVDSDGTRSLQRQTGEGIYMRDH